MASAVAMLALAAGLLALQAASAVHKAFALFLALRAGNVLLNVFRTAEGVGAAEAGYYLRVIPYFLLPVVPLLLYFLAAYPRPSPALARHHRGALLLGGAAVLAEAAYLLDHGLLWTVGPAAPGMGPFSSAGAGVAFVAYGPLVLLVGAIVPCYALAALRVARDAARHPGATNGARRLVALGFLLNALFDGTLAAGNLGALAGSGETYPWLPWGWALAVLPALALPLGAAALVALVQATRRSPDARHRGTGVLAACALPVGSALLLADLGPGAAVLADPLSRFVLGVWRLALPALVTYALVRYQLFDIDLRLKWTLRQSTVASAFVAVFFVASEGAQQFFAEGLGSAYVGIGAAGVLVLAMAPLQRAAERLADTAMPQVRPLAELDAGDRARLYREQAALAWEDGVLTAKDRRRLEALRAQLGLAAEDAARLELEAMAAAAQGAGQPQALGPTPTS